VPASAEPTAQAGAESDMYQLSHTGKYPKTALNLRVRQITYQGIGINAYEFVREDGGELEEFTAGTHVDLYFRDGRVRQYSLCNDPAERRRYLIAVLREDNGRGGSIAIHERVHTQRLVAVGHPRNNFPLIEGAPHQILLAGGIGITPLKAMVHRLERIGADYTLHYCAKSSAHAAFQEELAPLAAKGRVIMHFDGGNPAKGLDIAALLRRYEPGWQLYYCGPPGFMEACARACTNWPAEAVHFEYFVGAPVLPAEGVPHDIGSDALALGFQIKIASTGTVLTVPNDKSIAQVLGEHGIEVPTSCQSGLCGTCKVRYLAGDVEHRDYLLSAEARTQFLTTCVSRSKGATLVLDL